MLRVLIYMYIGSEIVFVYSSHITFQDLIYTDKLFWSVFYGGRDVPVLV